MSSWANKIEQLKSRSITPLQSECEKLGNKAFSIIELVEVAGVSEASFEIIRKKLLNLGNDIKRLSDKVGE